jgi:hypothetical protein
MDARSYESRCGTREGARCHTEANTPTELITGALPQQTCRENSRRSNSLGIPRERCRRCDRFARQRWRRCCCCARPTQAALASVSSREHRWTATAVGPRTARSAMRATRPTTASSVKHPGAACAHQPDRRQPDRHHQPDLRLRRSLVYHRLRRRPERSRCRAPTFLTSTDTVHRTAWDTSCPRLATKWRPAVGSSSRGTSAAGSTVIYRWRSTVPRARATSSPDFTKHATLGVAAVVDRRRRR